MLRTLHQFNALPVPMLRQVFFELFFRVFFCCCFSALLWRVPEAFFCGFSAQRCPKVIFLASFLMTFRVPARMRERCSRCSGSSIWRVGGGQRIDVFSMFFSESKKGVSLSVLLRFFAILGAPREPIGFQNGSKRSLKKGELTLH